ncbi:hypothetical protein KOR42_32910 [Thalassoglobus neptunius]|uniref:Uncharacterized protein n=1 Tax=Thalassoglobus neptunius TaxID=1938619 RepID=A0A5C5WMH2_9PLAN|nr:hypothetical protein KOR42_32910 [Thalassoglobus neptunius]
MTQALSVLFLQSVYILLLGVQSRNVRDSQVLGAMGTSILLGLCGIYLTPAIVQASASGEPLTLVAFVVAGPVGIAVAITAHDHLSNRRKN